jgi:hypothetical protein
MISVSKSPSRFFGLNLKTNQATVYRLRHKIDGRTTAWDTLRSSDLLHVKASRIRVLQSDLKTIGGTMAGGAYDTITEVMSESN